MCDRRFGDLVGPDLAVEADGQRADRVVQQRILEPLEDTIRLARALAHCAGVLPALTPKLRAKGSDVAVELFLTESAFASASTLSPRLRGTSIFMISRAARHFYDRRVGLGVAQELTGRPTFRLYGIAR